jgi:hypothetical protein
MSAIFISEQEAKEIIGALEYAAEMAEYEAHSSRIPGIKVQPPEFMEASRKAHQYSRLLADIGRRVK